MGARKFACYSLSIAGAGMHFSVLSRNKFLNKVGELVVKILWARELNLIDFYPIGLWLFK